ncbi:MAG: inosine monophosphate cyclohydrolase [Clostridiaceae bacterium]|jgi:IMP cyclohydrolase|nr:inosine monophosphate cyclohydrolase [Clostridiaceae bacterium]
MKTQELPQLLRKNPYPGRGVVLGVTPDGRQSAALYFIMGRSANSRNRVFVQEPDGIRTQARDPEKMEDPSLVIYHPVRRVGRSLIVTNGDQTDTILEYLERGQTLEQALRSREFEPDSPNWTPRISGLLSPDGGYKLSILKSADEKGSACLRQFFEYPGQPGLGHFIHTYVQDGSPLPTFEGEPERVEIGQDMEDFARQVWESLNEENKISLFVQYTSLETGEARQLIFNKYE